MKQVIALISLLFCVGCATAVPVQEGHPPQTYGMGGGRISTGFGYLPMLGVNVLETDEEIQDSDYSGTLPAMWFGAAFGLLEFLDVSYEGTVSSGSASRWGVKIQFLGDSYFENEGGLSAAISGRYTQSWNGGSIKFDIEDENGNDVEIDLGKVKGSYYEAALSIGYMFKKWIGIYGGGKGLQGKIEAEYERDDSNEDFEEKRDINGYGGFFGVNLSPHNKHIGFEFTAEVSLMNLPNTYSSGSTNYFSYGINLGMPFHF